MTLTTDVQGDTAADEATRLSTAPAPAPRRRRSCAPVRRAWRQLDQHAHRAAAAVPARARQRARLVPAAARAQPGRGAGVLRRAPDAGAAAGPAVAVRRLRLAVVRGDLPAAVRLLIGCLSSRGSACTPGRCAPRRRRCRGCSPGCRRTSAGRRRRTPTPCSADARRSLRRSRLARRHARAARRRPGAVGREGLPARDRQPAVPRLAGACCSSASRSAGCSASRARCWSRRATASPTASSPTTTSTPAAASTPTGWCRSASPSTTSAATYADDGKALTFDADAPLRRRPRREPRRRTTSGSTTRCDVGGAKAYLLGHGYAPEGRRHRRRGQPARRRPWSCLPQGATFLSTCVIKVPDAARRAARVRGRVHPDDRAGPRDRPGHLGLPGAGEPRR